MSWQLPRSGLAAMGSHGPHAGFVEHLGWHRNCLLVSTGLHAWWMALVRYCRAAAWRLRVQALSIAVWSLKLFSGKLWGS